MLFIFLPFVDAVLNATSAVLLVLGYIFIRKRLVKQHKTCMLAAVGTSTLFLVCYLTYHIRHGVIRFTGQGPVRWVYFSILGTHTVLAVVIVPLVLITLYRALRRRFGLHRHIARRALPLWLYVSVTGVVVYWMLFHLGQ